jgi:hypothetical protein
VTIEDYFRAGFWHILWETYIVILRIKIGSFSMEILTGNHTLLNLVLQAVNHMVYTSYFFQIIEK